MPRLDQALMVVTSGGWTTLAAITAPLGCAAIVGLVVAFLQTVTQLQEQSAAYFAKFLAVSGVLFLLGDRFATALLRLWNAAVAVAS